MKIIKTDKTPTHGFNFNDNFSQELCRTRCQNSCRDSPLDSNVKRWPAALKLLAKSLAPNKSADAIAYQPEYRKYENERGNRQTRRTVALSGLKIIDWLTQ